MNQHNQKLWAEKAFELLSTIDKAFDQTTMHAPETLKPLLLEYKQQVLAEPENTVAESDEISGD